MTGVMSRIEDLESRINGIELADSRMLEDLRNLLLESTVFLRESENAPVYIQERAKRLHNLLREKEDKAAYRASQYGPIYRQIDKIKDTDISDYFSPALKKRLDNMYPCRKTKGNAVFFRLGKTKYAIFGKIIKIIKAVPFSDAAKFHPSGTEIEIFPPKSEAFSSEIKNAEKLMILETARGTFGAYADELLGKKELDLDHVRKNLFDIYYPHRMIPGKFRIEGITYYLLKSWL